MSLLKNKTAIITGASRGIGKGIAEVFLKNGANVAFSYIAPIEEAEETEKELSKYGKIKGFYSDATDFDASHKLIDDVLNEFGQVDILVNNAGITRDNLLLRMGLEDFDAVMKVNLNSAFNLTKAVMKPMLKQRSGSIINISSIVGIKGNAGQANYAASKAGLIGLTKSVALELGSRNIRCNAVAPGFIETEMTKVLDEKTIKAWYDAIPLKRGGSPEDVANVCLFLASDLSDYVTGQVVSVDGGLHT